MKIIGHRGAKGLAPENTLLSIGHAIDHGVDEVEFDVRITKDGMAVLHHDPDLQMGGERLRISTHTYKELKRHKPELATLDEALDLIDNKVRPLIEIKPREAIGPVVSVLQQHLKSGLYTARDILVGSKSQRTLRAFHRAMPDIEPVVIESWSGVRASLRARQVGTKRISMRSWWLWGGFLRGMYRSGYQITPYTMNDPTKARRWEPWLYGVITDYPNRFQSE